jgi:hypothetical protein
MNVAVVYPCPCEPDVYQEFLPFARRYVQSYLKYPPGAEHDFFVAAMNPCDNEWLSVIPPFRDIRSCGEMQVWTAGIDIGCAQLCAEKLVAMRWYDFMVFSTSRVYFHREGWLRRLVDARTKYGDGLYGAVGSFECPNGRPEHFPNPHMRTVLYGCRPIYLTQMPRVTDRKSAHAFEAGNCNFANWFRDHGMPVKMVTWDEELDEWDWRRPANIFRRGDQSNILCFDKHSDNYRNASPAEKQRLERITG